VGREMTPLGKEDTREVCAWREWSELGQPETEYFMRNLGSDVSLSLCSLFEVRFNSLHFFELVRSRVRHK
jgi:hypothetical protein